MEKQEKSFPAYLLIYTTSIHRRIHNELKRGMKVQYFGRKKAKFSGFDFFFKVKKFFLKLILVVQSLKLALYSTICILDFSLFLGNSGIRSSWLEIFFLAYREICYAELTVVKYLGRSLR